LSSPNIDVKAGTPATPTLPKARKWRSTLVELFTGEEIEVHLVDWLPSLHRASQCNGWLGEEQVIRLTGYLKERPLQDWNIVGEDQMWLSIVMK